MNRTFAVTMIAILSTGCAAAAGGNTRAGSRDATSTSPGATAPCRVVGPSRVVASSVFVPAGVEARIEDGRMTLRYAHRKAQCLETSILEPGSTPSREVGARCPGTSEEAVATSDGETLRAREALGGSQTPHVELGVFVYETSEPRALTCLLARRRSQTQSPRATRRPVFAPVVTSIGARLPATRATPERWPTPRRRGRFGPAWATSGYRSAATKGRHWNRKETGARPSRSRGNEAPKPGRLCWSRRSPRVERALREAKRYGSASTRTGTGLSTRTRCGGATGCATRRPWNRRGETPRGERDGASCRAARRLSRAADPHVASRTWPRLPRRALSAARITRRSPSWLGVRAATALFATPASSSRWASAPPARAALTRRRRGRSDALPWPCSF